MKKLLLFIWLIVFCFGNINGQSPYELKTGREVALFGTGVGLLGGGYLLHKKLEPLTLTQINALEAEGISRFERWVTTRRSVSSNTASDVVLYSAQTFPVAMTLLDGRMRKDAFKIGNMYGETFLINAGLTALVKNLVHRTRPYVYNRSVPDIEKTARSARNSFYSGHTSQTASMCFLTAQLYADYHPDSKWKPVVWSFAAAVPLSTGILRMTAGKHFPTDVAVGYVTGALIGILVPRLHRVKGF